MRDLGHQRPRQRDRPDTSCGLRLLNDHPAANLNDRALDADRCLIRSMSDLRRPISSPIAENRMWPTRSEPGSVPHPALPVDSDGTGAAGSSSNCKLSDRYGDHPETGRVAVVGVRHRNRSRSSSVITSTRLRNLQRNYVPTRCHRRHAATRQGRDRDDMGPSWP
jgi:hypothetical protein